MTLCVDPLRTLALTALLAVSSSTAATAADTDDGPRQSRLELLPAPLGGTSGIDLRTGSPNAPFVLLLDAAVNSIDADGAGPFPWLRVFSGSSVLVATTTDGTGRFRVVAPVGNDASLQGATVFAQALTVTPASRYEATNVAATTITPGAAAWSYADASAGVPSDAALNASGPGAARDLDGDGDPDLVVVSGAGFSARVYRNDGNLNFTDVSATAIPAGGDIEASNVELFDADGDGREDILVIGGVGDPNSPPLPNLLLRNQGGLTFQLVSFPDVPGIARDIAVLDIDRDGDLDVVLANGFDGVHAGEQASPNALLVNQGFAQGGTEGDFVIDAAFQNASWNGAGFNIAVCAGDIDNDGDQDLFFGRSDTQLADGIPGATNLLIRNDGGLVFTDVSAANLQPLFSDNTAGARFGDLDGDGWLDLMVANTTVSVVSALSGDYYRNQGNGVFVEDPTSFPAIDESEVALRLGLHLDDVDLDGDLDVIQFLHEFIDFNGSSGNPSGTGGDDLLFVNQGGAQGGTQGVFVQDLQYTSTGIFVSFDHVIADFDLDGDNDVYICNQGGFFTPLFPVDDRLLENTRIP